MFYLRYIFISMILFFSLHAEEVGHPFLPLAHTQRVTLLDCNESVMLSASSDQSIKVWDIAHQKLIRTFSKHKMPLTYTKHIPNTMFVVSVDSSGELFLWNIKTGKIIKKYKLPENFLNITLLENPSYLLLAGDKTEAFNIVTGQTIPLHFQAHGISNMSRFIKTNDKGNTFLVNKSMENKLLLYDINGTITQTIDTGEAYVTATLAGNTKYVAISFPDGRIKIWDLKSKQFIKTFRTEITGKNHYLQFSPHATKVALADSSMVHIIDMEAPSKITIDPYSFYEQISAFSFVNEEVYILGKEDGKLLYRDLSNRSFSEFNSYARSVTKVSFSKSDKDMFIASNNRDYKSYMPTRYYGLYDYRTAEETKLFHTKHERVVTASFLNNKWFITGGFDGKVTIWSVEKRRKHKVLDILNHSIAYIALSSDEKLLAAVDANGSIDVRDMNSSKSIFNFKADREFSQGLRFSPHGHYLLYRDSFSMKVWETDSWKLLQDVNISLDKSCDIKFSDHEHIVYIDPERSTVVSFNILSGTKNEIFNLKKFIEENPKVFVLTKENKLSYHLDHYTFSHKGDKLLLIINNQHVILNLMTGDIVKLDAPFDNTGYIVKDFHFSFDDKVVGSIDSSVLHLWNVDDGQKLMAHELYRDDPNIIISTMPYDDVGLVFSSNSQGLASSLVNTYFHSMRAAQIDIWRRGPLKKPDNVKTDRYLNISDFSMDDNALLYGTSGPLVLLEQNISVSKELESYRGVSKVKLFKHQYIIAMGDKEIYVLDRKSKKQIHTFTPLSGHFTSFLISPDGTTLIASSRNVYTSVSKNKDDINSTVLFFDIKTGKTLSKVDTFGYAGVYASASSQSGDVIVLGGLGSALAVNLKTNKSLLLSGHNGYITSIAVDDTKSMILTGSEDNTVKLWDLQSGKLIHTYVGHQGKINSVVFHPEQPYAVSGSADGTVKYWYLDRPKEVATFASFHDEWITLLPEGYFVSSTEASRALNILFSPMKIGSMDQVYDTFFRPDLVKMKLEGKDITPFIKDINITTVLKDPPPSVHISTIEGKDIKDAKVLKEGYFTSKDKVSLTFNVENESAGIGLIRIYQEGKLIQTIGKGKIDKQSANLDTLMEQERLDKKVKKMQKKYMASLSKSIEGEIPLSSRRNDCSQYIQHLVGITKGNYTLDIDLKAGKNEISIEAFNKTNTVSSYRETMIIHANIPEQKPKLYAIVAGVNKFESPIVKDLKYSQNDAKAIRELVKKQMNTVFEEVEVIDLSGENLTKNNIFKAIQKIASKAKLTDTILFYISTHGRAARGKLYLVPQNNKLVKSWIDFEQTFKAVQSIKALNQVFIIDACESGKANDIVSSVYDSRASVLAKSSGVHMLLATTKGSYAFEHPDKDIQHGVFTYKILQLLKDRVTDMNGDNMISIFELSKKLKEKEYNEVYQYPVIRNVGSDIILEKVINK